MGIITDMTGMTSMIGMTETDWGTKNLGMKGNMRSMEKIITSIVVQNQIERKTNYLVIQAIKIKRLMV